MLNNKFSKNLIPLALTMMKHKDSWRKIAISLIDLTVPMRPDCAAAETHSLS